MRAAPTKGANTLPHRLHGGGLLRVSAGRGLAPLSKAARTTLTLTGPGARGSATSGLTAGEEAPVGQRRVSTPYPSRGTSLPQISCAPEEGPRPRLKMGPAGGRRGEEEKEREKEEEETGTAHWSSAA